MDYEVDKVQELEVELRRIVRKSCSW